MPKLLPHQRFEAMITREADGSCSFWKGHKKADGSGLFILKNGTKSRQCTTAQRYAYRFYIGPIPDGMYVTSKCKNKLCVEQTHLRLKSRSDVVKAGIKAGQRKMVINFPKAKCGEANLNSVVSDADVIKMREERELGAKLIVLARRYKTSTSNVSVICRGETRNGELVHK